MMLTPREKAGLNDDEDPIGASSLRFRQLLPRDWGSLCEFRWSPAGSVGYSRPIENVCETSRVTRISNDGGHFAEGVVNQ